MRIKIIEPVILDEKEILQEERYLKSRVNPGVEIEFATITDGFESIESEIHTIFNAPEIILKAKKAEEEAFDGVFINCFADPGVYAVRETIKIPVLGGFLPSLLTAASLSEKVCIIATDTNGVNLVRRNLRSYGLRDRVGVIKNVGLGVLELNNKEILLERLISNCIEVIENDGINVFIFGCTGMSYIAEELRSSLRDRGCSATIVEPLETGVRYLEYLIGLGHTNSLSYKISLDALKWG
ncbi:MAG TPA: aspartate/glutamate racemase family protein [Anaerovoracaceae bacterium]|nr:aspartate/glutamate racemase family protein [Anaerovoracaceae bacterium]